MSSAGRFILGAMVGGAIGAALGMLLAPRSGVETREMIREDLSSRYRSTRDRVEHEVNDKTEKLRSKASELGSRVKQISEELEERGRVALSKIGTAVKTAEYRPGESPN